MIIYLIIIGSIVWHLILRRGAYPKQIPVYLKWLHAVILYYVLIYSWSELISLAWLVLHPDQISLCLASQPNSIGKPLVGITKVIESLTGPALLLICSLMAKRREKALRWYFIFWPITFFASLYTAIMRLESQLPINLVILGVVISIGIFILSLAFYISARIRSIIFTPK
jgi:hypothetical protein